MFVRVPFLALLLALFLQSVEGFAVPAIPHNISVTQDDGSSIEIRVHGDEFFGWRTTVDGSPIAEKGGNYYYVKYSEQGEMEYSQQRVIQDGRVQAPPSGFNQSVRDVSSIVTHVAAQQRTARASSIASSASVTRSSVSGLPFETNGFPTSGEVKSIVLLLEFTDTKFTTFNVNSAINNSLNMEGYSAYGATGSARDYFLDNSGGAFDGQFDVYGPYTLPQNMSYYGGNDRYGLDSAPQQMVIDGANLALADGVDFSQYDLDGDGVVDNIFIYYAGYNEAEGASSDTIWPHKWAVVTGANYSGKSLYIYACTSELRGVSGSVLAGIGTFCHEFSHVFGLADHYDTDEATNGYSIGLYSYDVMCFGSYNNDGCTPPLFNALELMILGWGTPMYYNESGSVTQQPISSGEFYRVDTDVEDEFFLVENRQRSSSAWDEYLVGDGLLITHVDMSSNYIALWSEYYNNPNGNTSHECFKIVPANNADLNSTYDYSTGLWSSTELWSNICYPTKENTSWGDSSSPRGESWSGANLNFGLSNITRSGLNIIYDVEAYGYYATVWQRDAIVGWMDEEYESYRVVVSSESEEFEFFTSESSLVIDGLESDTRYSFVVYGLDSEGVEEVVAEGTITTMAQNSDIPIVALSAYEYSTSSTIYLKAINLEQEDVCRWYVDGSEVSEGLYTPSVGEHTIKCVVTRGSDSYVVIKEISVL